MNDFKAISLKKGPWPCLSKGRLENFGILKDFLKTNALKPTLLFSHGSSCGRGLRQPSWFQGTVSRRSLKISTISRRPLNRHDQALLQGYLLEVIHLPLKLSNCHWNPRKSSYRVLIMRDFHEDATLIWSLKLRLLIHDNMKKIWHVHYP